MAKKATAQTADGSDGPKAPRGKRRVAGERDKERASRFVAGAAILLEDSRLESFGYLQKPLGDTGLVLIELSGEQQALGSRVRLGERELIYPKALLFVMDRYEPITCCATNSSGATLTLPVDYETRGIQVLYGSLQRSAFLTARPPEPGKVFLVFPAGSRILIDPMDRAVTQGAILNDTSAKPRFRGWSVVGPK